MKKRILKNGKVELVGKYVYFNWGGEKNEIYSWSFFKGFVGRFMLDDGVDSDNYVGIFFNFIKGSILIIPIFLIRSFLHIFGLHYDYARGFGAFGSGEYSGFVANQCLICGRIKVLLEKGGLKKLVLNNKEL